MTDIPRIVVGVGDIDDGMRPLVWALAEARRRGAELHAVRVWRDRNQTGAMSAYWRHELAEAAQQSLIDAFLSALGAIPHDVTVRMVVREGLVADSLLSYADRDSDLLVLGTSRRRRLFWGEMTVRRCVQRAHCAVTVVPNVLSGRKAMRDFRRELNELVSPM